MWGSMAPADSGAHGPVDTFTHKVRVSVVAAVLQKHVHHHHPQGHVLAPPRLMLMAALVVAVESAREG